MICFDKEDTRFTYRVAGIILHNDHVLLNRFEGGKYWFLPGGRAELGETSIESLQREMREELGEEAQVERLLWIAETFYSDKRRSYHEVALYFLASFAASSGTYQQHGPFPGQEEEAGLTFQWFALDDLDKLTLYPPFLKARLRQELPEHSVHVLDEGRKSR
ncbi:MAG TPA: NUDIX hydrolase [Ktedonosporobacter sp.]|nr:NUDIX hydrolase [Ktedonosporobacter sp.]